MRKPFPLTILVLVGLGLVAGGAGTWLVFGSNTPSYEGERGVKIPPGTGFDAATDSLVSSGILRSPGTFRLVGSVTGWRDQIKAGYYTFEAGTSNYALLDKLRKGLQSYVRLTIPPGTRPEVVAAVAGRDMASTPEAFLAALQDTSLAAELGTDVRHLFGYMLPETYFFYWLTPPETVVRKIKEQFDQFYDAQLAAGADSLGLSKDDVVNLAAIVEWETGIENEKPRVAGVYLNRLRIGMALQADPTVQYAVLAQEGQKRRLLHADYDIAHPYNTYLYRGLPPSPITNPSPSSLLGVAQAEHHGYLYFVADAEGGHTFSRTYEEHLRAASRYHQTMRQRRQASDGPAD